MAEMLTIDHVDQADRLTLYIYLSDGTVAVLTAQEIASFVSSRSLTQP